jgi:hypothetical protein
MKKRCLFVALVLAACSALAAPEEPGGRPVDTPVISPSPSPSPGPPGRRRGPPIRPRTSASPKTEVADRYNHTQVQVVSVDATAGAMTFLDVEGETQTWQFEPVGLARDPLLKPGARVTIVWKSDASGQPIPKILGVVAFNRPTPAPASNMAGRGRPRRSEDGTSRRPRSRSGSPSPSPPPPR